MKEEGYIVPKTLNFKADHSGNFKYESPDNERHSHDWVVKIYLESDILVNDIIVDFNKIEEIQKQFEGKYLNELECFKDMTPTTERISFYIANEIDKLMFSKNYKITVTTYETQTRSATRYIKSTED